MKTIESARSQIEIREYYQTDQIEWMAEKGRWTGLKTISKVVTTVEKEEKTTREVRYYISSLPVEVTCFKRAVRGHWGIESFHIGIWMCRLVKVPIIRYIKQPRAT